MEIKFNEEEFYKAWKERTEEIKKQSFNKYQVSNLFRIFSENLKWLVFNGNLKDFQKIQELLMELMFAFEISESNYRKEKKGFWANICGFGIKKFPEFNIKDWIK